MPFVTFDMRELDAELSEAAAQIVLEVANEYVNQLQDEAPVGATGTLQQSFQLFRTDDDVVVLGTRVPYAEGVWKGKPPHSPDFEELRVWARRVLGDESAAGPVYTKIQREGTEPNDYVGRARRNTLDRIGQLTFGQF